MRQCRGVRSWKKIHSTPRNAYLLAQDTNRGNQEARITNCSGQWRAESVDLVKNYPRMVDDTRLGHIPEHKTPLSVCLQHWGDTHGPVLVRVGPHIPSVYPSVHLYLSFVYICQIHGKVVRL